MTDPINGFGEAYIFGPLSILILWIAKRNGYFKTIDQPLWRTELEFWHIGCIFVIYFGASFFLPGLLVSLYSQIVEPPISQMHFLSWISASLSLLIFLSFAFFLFTLPQKTRSSIWRAPAAIQPYTDDLKIAALTWVITFPLVAFTSEFLDGLVYYLFHVTHLPDQNAVFFVKMTFSEPLYFLLAVITIVILAPMIEEILFRGFLQSFIRKHLGPFQAIVITSFCFSFFHYSPEQGLGNIPIVGSLFSFALFLGYLYERQGSLFAPMALHALFNCISVLNLYFLGGVPRGTL